MITLIAIALIVFTATMYTVVKVTDYLEDKPKTNKFRQWWSNNVVDLDNRYSD
jgi:enamine deaminase RidA (YjgF/YER057c/UK114 family)